MEAKRCHYCGKCVSGCEVNRLDPSFRPDRLINLAIKGELDRLLDDGAIWKCTTCYGCAERCPQGLSVTDVLWCLRARAAAAGRAAHAWAAQKETLVTSGRLYAANASDRSRREKAGLPPVEDDPVAARIFDVAAEGGKR
jgi:heterodisulfide reductase subunit C2